VCDLCLGGLGLKSHNFKQCKVASVVPASLLLPGVVKRHLCIIMPRCLRCSNLSEPLGQLQLTSENG